jgi:cytoskeletal protein CcmA (bactofilin family)
MESQMNNYVLFSEDSLKAAQTHVCENIEYEGGTLRVKGGAVINGNLSKTTIISVDGSPIKVSVLANLDGCVINGGDIIVDGAFSGEINAQGDVELGDTSSLQGTITHKGRVVIGSLAETEFLKIKKIAVPKGAQMKNAYFDTVDEAAPVHRIGLAA